MAANPKESPLQSPMRLLDSLFFREEHEKHGTPRPSKAKVLFINGMQALSVGQLDKAKEKLEEAVTEVQKEKAKKEEVAICLVGLGYLHACQPPATRDLKKAAELYMTGVQMFEDSFGADCPQISPLTADAAIVFFMAGDKENASQVLARARKQLINADKIQPGQTEEHHKRTLASLYAQVSQSHVIVGEIHNAVALMKDAVAVMEKFKDPSLKVAQVVLKGLMQQEQKQSAQ